METKLPDHSPPPTLLATAKDSRKQIIIDRGLRHYLACSQSKSGFIYRIQKDRNASIKIRKGEKTYYHMLKYTCKLIVTTHQNILMVMG